MNKAYTRINWENYTSTNTPLNATNLNKVDLALDTVDDRVVSFDLTKAEQSELLGCLSNVAYDTTTGVFTFTYKNGTTFTADINIEKIPVSFSMSEAGIITMTTTDGSTYTADVASLIKTYSFTDSSDVAFTTTTDASGNKSISASIVNGSVTEEKLQPNYLADIRVSETNASNSKNSASASALVAEGYSNGTQNGVEVTSESTYFHNNSKYWKEQAQAIAGQTLGGLTDVNIENPSDKDALIYDSSTQTWKNGKGSVAIALESPSDLVATAGDATVSLSWTNPEDITIGSTKVGELDHINIVRDNVVIATTTSTSYTDNNVVNDTTYTYRVDAITTESASSSSESVSATPSLSIVATINVVGADANASITVTDGTHTYNRVASESGSCAIGVSDYGTYTVTTSGRSKTVTVVEGTESYTLNFGESTIALTVEGAYDDTIEMYKATDLETRVALFTMGSSTSDTETVTIEDGAEYYFVSTTTYNADGTSAKQSKTVVLDGDSTNVKVMPSGALYWHGNECTDVTGGFARRAIALDTSYYYEPQMLDSSIKCLGNKSAPPYGTNFTTNNLINATEYDKVGFNIEHKKGALNWGVLISANNTDLTWYSQDGLNINTNGYIGYRNWSSDGTNSSDVEDYVYALWLDKKRSLPTTQTDSVTLTIEGAKADNITIYDAYGEVVDYVTFDSDATSKEVTLNIRKGGETLKFVSSVAKDTENGSYNYSKTITLTQSSSDTVLRIMPTDENGYGDVNYLPWYENNSGGWNVVPIMTSLTTPYGEAFCSSQFNEVNGAIKAFDEDASNDQWTSSSNKTCYLGYVFPNPTRIKKFKIAFHPIMTSTTAIIEASNSRDASSWTQLKTFTTTNVAKTLYEFDNNNSYSAYRIRITNQTRSSGTEWGLIRLLQFYGN